MIIMYWRDCDKDFPCSHIGPVSVEEFDFIMSYRNGYGECNSWWIVPGTYED